MDAKVDTVRFQLTAINKRREDTGDGTGRIALDALARLQTRSSASKARELTIQDVICRGLNYDTRPFDIPDVD